MLENQGMLNGNGPLIFVGFTNPFITAVWYTPRSVLRKCIVLHETVTVISQVNVLGGCDIPHESCTRRQGSLCQSQYCNAAPVSGENEDICHREVLDLDPRHSVAPIIVGAFFVGETCSVTQKRSGVENEQGQPYLDKSTESKIWRTSGCRISGI